MPQSNGIIKSIEKKESDKGVSYTLTIDSNGKDFNFYCNTPDASSLNEGDNIDFQYESKTSGMGRTYKIINSFHKLGISKMTGHSDDSMMRLLSNVLGNSVPAMIASGWEEDRIVIFADKLCATCRLAVSPQESDEFPL